MTSTKVAIIQEPTAVLNLKEGINRAVKHIGNAAANGGKLIVFPESWLTGYPAWVFGMAGWDDADTRYWYQKFLDQCPTHDGEELEPIRKAARDAGVIVSLGFNERQRTDAGSVYNSVILIGRDGATLNLHRKLTPTYTERNIWAQGDASGLNVVPTNIGNIGGLICWEHWHPLIRQSMHALDEQIHVACWPDMPDSHAIASQHYAFEGRCFVLAAAQYLTIDDVPEELIEAYRLGIGPAHGNDSLLFNGGSGVVGPDGHWLSGQLFDQAGTIFAEIEIDATAAFKHDLDVVGHYSRSDIFQLSVDRRALRSVTWLENDELKADTE